MEFLLPNLVEKGVDLFVLIFNKHSLIYDQFNFFFHLTCIYKLLTLGLYLAIANLGLIICTICFYNNGFCINVATITCELLLYRNNSIKKNCNYDVSIKF